MESAVYNDVISKRVGSLEQTRKGLKLRDVIDFLSANHEILQPLDRFLEKIKFEEGNEITRSFFIRYLQKANPQKLEKIVMYLTRCRFLLFTLPCVCFLKRNCPQRSFTYSKLTIEILEQGERSVQS